MGGNVVAPKTVIQKVLFPSPGRVRKAACMHTHTHVHTRRKWQGNLGFSEDTLRLHPPRPRLPGEDKRARSAADL